MRFLCKNGKFLAVFLCVLVLIQTIAYAENNSGIVGEKSATTAFEVDTPPQTSILYGDVNGDMSVSSRDYEMLEDYILGNITVAPSDSVFAAADVDINGVLDSFDYWYVFQHIMGIVKELPVVYSPSLIDELVHVSIDSVYGRHGDIITIPIRLQNVSSEGISNFGFNLSYDSKLFEFISVSKEISAHHSSKYVGTFSVMFTQKIEANFIDENQGIILSLGFRIKDDAAFGSYELNAKSLGMGSFDGKGLNKINYEYSGGQITVVPMIIGDINADSIIDSGDYTLMNGSLKGRKLPLLSSIIAADIDQNGVFDAADCDYMKQHLVMEIPLPTSATPTQATPTPTPKKPSKPPVDTSYMPTKRTSGDGNVIPKVTNAGVVPTNTPIITTPTPKTTSTPTSEIDEPIVEMPSVIFSDINGHWSEANLIKAHKLELIKGYGDGTVRPENPITRYETSILLVKLLGVSPEKKPEIIHLYDKETIPVWVSPYLNAVVDYGVMNGFTDGTFRGNKNLTRAEAATVLIKTYSLIKSVEEPGLKSFKPREIDKYKDYNKNHWANVYLDKAIEAKIMAGYMDETIKPDINVTRSEFFAMCINLINLLQ